jgi:hypothetical protein
MFMSALRNEHSPYRQTQNSYDPLIWRKDVHVVNCHIPHNIHLDSGNVEKESTEKIVKSIMNNQGMFI